MVVEILVSLKGLPTLEFQAQEDGFAKIEKGLIITNLVISIGWHVVDTVQLGQVQTSPLSQTSCWQGRYDLVGSCHE